MLSVSEVSINLSFLPLFYGYFDTKSQYDKHFARNNKWDGECFCFIIAHRKRIAHPNHKLF